MSVVFVLVTAFLLGGLPWSLWVARHHGIDLREHGSGNLGATNVYRVLGWKMGLGVLVLDVAKGVAAVAMARMVLAGGAGPAFAGLFAVAGHMFTPFAGFRGGKGVATSLGAMLGLAEVASLMSVLVWLGTMLFCGWVSLASGMGALALPVFVHWTRDDLGARYPWVLALSVCLALLVIVRHRSNWERIAEGKEQPIWEDRPESPGEGAQPPEAAT